MSQPPPALPTDTSLPSTQQHTLLAPQTLLPLEHAMLFHTLVFCTQVSPPLEFPRSLLTPSCN